MATIHATFARTYYVSATLRVAGEWTFIRQRLGLGSAVDQIALDTPFTLGTQAELVCLSDFPSWAEQSEGATRTVAHQLAGYSAEMVRPLLHTRQLRPRDVDQALSDPARGGFDGGAMVLTTARSTAGGIASHRLRDLRARDETPTSSALSFMAIIAPFGSSPTVNRWRLPCRHQGPVAGRGCQR